MKKELKKTALTSAILYTLINNSLYAACPNSSLTGITVSNDSCSATRDTYTNATIKATNQGKLTLQGSGANTEIEATGIELMIADNRGIIEVKNNIRLTATNSGNRISLVGSRSGGKIYFDKDVYIISVPPTVNGGALVAEYTGYIQIDGKLTINTKGGRSVVAYDNSQIKLKDITVDKSPPMTSTLTGIYNAAIGASLNSYVEYNNATVNNFGNAVYSLNNSKVVSTGINHLTSELNDTPTIVVASGGEIDLNSPSKHTFIIKGQNSIGLEAQDVNSAINITGPLDLDFQNTSGTTIKNSTNAVITLLGDITSIGEETAINNNNATINLFGKNNNFNGYQSTVDPNEPTLTVPEYQAGGHVLNTNGTINMSNYDETNPIQGTLFGKLKIAGNYTGTNGILKIDTKLASDDLTKNNTDFITIGGSATGSTELKVVNAGGSGAKTYRKGIHIIETKSSTPNAFFIANGGYVTAGAYDYGLFRETEGASDNWYLRSQRNDGGIDPEEPSEPVYTPDVGEYLAVETMGNTIFSSRLEDREGASQYQGLSDKNVGNVWVRAYGKHNQFKSMESQLKTTGTSFVTQVGTGLVTLGEEDQYNLGVIGGFATYDGKTRSNLTDRESKTKINGYSLGLYGTWYAHPVEKRGAYIDSWVLWNKFKNKIDTPDQNQYKYDSSGVTASIEIGGDYLINKNGKKNWWIQPQSQVIYQGVHADDFKDAQGVNINHGQDNVQARMGVKTYLEIPTNNNKLTSYRPYVALNFIHNTNPYSVVIDDVRYENEGSKNLGEVKVGIEGNVTQNSQVWLNASYVEGSHSNQSYQGNIGWKYNF